MIRAIDTNVAVRLLTNDDPAQAAAARAIVDEDFALTATVMMEIEWVLRSAYRWSREMRAAGLRLLLALPALVHAPKDVEWAIDRLAEGADFADMMHLASAGPVDCFVTFDRRLATLAGREPPVPVETLG